jgi:toxin ParE1/3/4
VGNAEGEAAEASGLMPDVLFSEAAETDVADAVDWYEQRAPGLGADLVSEIDAVVQRIGSKPEQFPLVHKEVRRALLRRFPYAIFFRALDTHLQVIACFHTSRDPRIWRARLG